MKILHIEDYDEEKGKNYSLALKKLIPEHEVKNIEYLEDLCKGNLKQYDFLSWVGSFQKMRIQSQRLNHFN